MLRKNQHIPFNMSHALQYLIALLVLGFFSAIFIPGLNGPFVFDDLPNITSNFYLKIDNLDLSTLYNAAWSNNSGPLGRPIPMASFALNFYFGNGFESTQAFKLTNLAIHLTNAYLVFLVFLTIQKLYEKTSQHDFESNIRFFYISLTLAVIWLVHPLQTNVVHYIVQRMASLSAMFVLLGLLSYLHGRPLIANHKPAGYVALFILVPVFFILGIFSKENAVLMIPFIFLIEYFLFRKSSAWKWTSQLDQRYLISILMIIAITMIVVVTIYTLPGYATREFTLPDRLLTQTRVLSFYLSLIFFPVINKFGLFHDYFSISHGLFDPVTTLISIVFISSLVLVSFRYRKRFPYLFFGVMWFFIAHALESTFIALELVHEHRNYIALIGPLFASTGLFSFIYNRYRSSVYLTIVAILVGSISLITFLRSNDWSSEQELFLAESSYHPRSPRAQGAFGAILIKKGHLEKGFNAMSRAYELQPNEPGYLINIAIINDMMKKPLPTQWEKRAIELFSQQNISPLAMAVLHDATKCALTECRNIRETIERIAHACANRKTISTQKRAQCLFYEGTLKGYRNQHQEAAQLLISSYNLDKKSLHPLFGLAFLHIRNNNYAGAKLVILDLIRVNKKAEYPRSSDLVQLIALYNKRIPLNSPDAILDTSK